MHNFVEFLRAKRAVQIALILLGLFLAVVIVFRVTVSFHGSSIEQWELGLQQSPTAHVTRSTLSDGSKHIVVDDPQRQTRAEIFERPGGRIDMEVTEPKSASGGHDSFSIGSVSINESTNDGQTRTIVHYMRDVPRFELGILFLVTIPMGLIVASLLGGALSKENDGHLDLAWTKPVSRERYALAAIVMDAAAIIVSQLLTIAVTLAATLMFFVPRFSYGDHMGWYVFMALAGPLAWYACVTAASASLKRGPGIVIGLGWVAAIIIPSIAAGLSSLAQVNQVAAWFHAIFIALAYIDPVTYLSFSGAHGSSVRNAVGTSIPVSAGILLALFVGYAALALVQWRRLEA